MLLESLKAPYGATHKKKRLGRGDSSGHGTTAGRGSKGQRSRSGAKIAASFEGGQMPLQRRLPKRGFTNIFRKIYSLISVGELEKLDVTGNIDLEVLKKIRRVPKSAEMLKVLGDGEVKKKLTVVAHKFSKTAKEKIEKAGGKVEVA